MGMISDTEAQGKSICAFCEQPIYLYCMNNAQVQLYRSTSLCPSCQFDAKEANMKDTQLDFELSSESPIPIISYGAINISWLMMHHPKTLIGSHITVENYGLTAKFTIIPPTKEAGEKINNTIRDDREQRNYKPGRSYKSHARTRHKL